METLSSKTSEGDQSLDSLLDRFVEFCGLSSLEEHRDNFSIAVKERIAAKEIEDVKAYLDLLANRTNEQEEFKQLAAKLTIGETYFMRHPEVFKNLREELLKRLEGKQQPSLKIWSAACSIGCEPYSLAILCQELQSQIKDLKYEIWATDLNQDFLQQAREAHYTKWSIRNLDTESIDRYFERSGTKFILRERYKRGVHFHHHNLMNPPPQGLVNPAAPIDLILCRNVLIYFDQVRIERLAAQFYNMLSPNGMLVLGPSETNPITYHKFRNLNYPNAVIYSKDKATPESSQKTYAPPQLGSSLRTTHSTTTLPLPIKGNERETDPENSLSRLLREENYDAFLASAQKAICTDDLNSRLHLECGFAYAKTARPVEAEQHLKKALYLDRHSLEAHFLLAKVTFEQKKPSESLKALKKVLSRLNEADAEALKLPNADLPIREGIRQIQFILDSIDQL